MSQQRLEKLLTRALDVQLQEGQRSMLILLGDLRVLELRHEFRTKFGVAALDEFMDNYFYEHRHEIGPSFSHFS